MLKKQRKVYTKRQEFKFILKTGLITFAIGLIFIILAAILPKGNAKAVTFLLAFSLPGAGVIALVYAWKMYAANKDSIKKQVSVLPEIPDNWDEFVKWCVSCEYEYNNFQDDLRLGAYTLFWYNEEVLNGGHLQFFINKADWDFDKLTKLFEPLLPRRQLDNFIEAVDCYKSLKNIKTFPKTIEEYTMLEKDGIYSEYDDAYDEEQVNKALESIASKLDEILKLEENDFWKVINMLDWQNEGDDEKVLKPALEYLAQKSDKEIFKFDEILSKLLYDLDSKDLAKRVYKNKADFSEDLFLYLRCVAVVNGKDFYYKILSGERVLDSDMEFESVLYLPHDAWALKNKKNAAEYPHTTRYSYETGSNQKLWN